MQSAAKRLKVSPDDGSVVSFQTSLEEVERLQAQIDIVNEERSEKVLAIEREYNKLLRPQFGKRDAIINTIPRFWFKVLLQHPQIGCVIQPRDQDLLRSLTHLSVDVEEDVRQSFQITFNFAPNNYFENSTLRKCVKYSEEADENVSSTEIEWKAGKSLVEPSGDSEDGENESFFHWFDPEDQEVEIAELIKEEVYQDPLKYYFFGEEEQDDDEEDED